MDWSGALRVVRHRQLAVAVVVAMAVVASGCSTSGHPHAERAPSSTGTGAARHCPASTSTTTRMAVGSGRLVLVHTPARPAGAAPLALVLNLHGSGSTAAAQMAFTGMNTTADADGFVVAYPQGAIVAGSGFDWNVPGQPLVGGAAVPAGAADDVAFMSAVIARLDGARCLDPTQLFITGFSGGARLASQLGCSLATVAAIAPVSGLRLPDSCPHSLPVMSFHGTADPVDPYAGNGQAYWTYSVPEAASRWAAHDGCSTTPARATPASGVTLTSYGGCDEGSAVELYTIAGAGHTWPGGPTLPASLTRALGPQSHAIDADDLMWAFFQQHHLR